MTACRTVVEVSCNRFEILEVGIQGPPGPQGIQGPPGEGQQEVYFQALEPAGVTWPAIWFEDLGGDEVRMHINDV